MNLQRLTPVVLPLVVVGLLSAALGSALHGWIDSDHVSHGEGAACPDPEDDGHPCGPACPCACCPGHLSAATFPTVRVSVGTPPAADPEAPGPRELCSQDVRHRIFHPPRA